MSTKTTPPSASTITFPTGGGLSRRGRKFVFIGYSPECTDEERQDEDRLLEQNFETILSNRVHILETPKFFFVQLLSAFLSTPYFGGGPIPLGALFELWESGAMLDDCPICGGRFYGIGAGGGLGGSQIWGICPSCRAWGRIEDAGAISREQRGYPFFRSPVLAATKKYRNEDIIQRGKHQVFDWAEGLVGEATPDVVIRPAVQAASLVELLQELGGEIRTSA